MVANKFATMLHKNTNRITLILVYVLLEWILIVLLLLNSLFSYLIIKFADYFCLKRPCLWCSRLDHVFEPSKYENSYRDLVCDDHANEISRLGFCSNHRRLSESRDMCGDCLSSSQPDVMENGDENFKCSCCGVVLEKKWNLPCFMIKPSWEVLDNPQKGNLIAESGEKVDEGNASDGIKSDFVADDREDEQKIEENKGAGLISDGDEMREMEKDGFSCFVSSLNCNQVEGDLILSMEDQRLSQLGCSKEESPEILAKHLEFYIEGDDCHLIPVELLDSDAEGGQKIYKLREEDQNVSDNGDVVFDFDLLGRAPVELAVANSCKVETMESKEEEDDQDVSWEVLDNPQKGNLIAESGEKVDEGNASDGIKSNFVADDREDEQKIKENKGAGLISDGDEMREMEKDGFLCFVSSLNCNQAAANGDDEGDMILSMEDQGLSQLGCSKEESPEILAKHLEFYIEGDDCYLIPVELLDSDAEGGQKIYKFREEDQGVSDNGDVVFDFDLLGRAPVELAVANSCKVETMESKEEEDEQEVGSIQATMAPLNEADDVQANEATREGEINVDTNQANEPIEDIQMQNLDECTSSDHGCKDSEEVTTQFNTATTVETSEQAMKNHFSLSSDLYEIEEDKVPDTPTSIDSVHLLHKKWLLLDRRESGTEDSLDESVFSDIEGVAGVLTVEKLKSALKTKRKALNALYRELEEERSASEVAASQTMAMINRLQEEKAAMQMEALQYQRMMEEQSEYDQEALQLLNELMVKREKEKAELEKELEIYRKKVMDYEAKERMTMLRRRKDDCTRSSSSASCGNAEDSDGVSVDLNHESKEEHSFESHQIREDSNPNTPANAILYLEESLASFEEERLSILEQLKVLEEKLVSLNDEEAEQHFKYFYEENGNGFRESPDFGHETGVANGHFKGVNGKHHEDKIVPMAAKAKRLLPLFDASDAEIEGKKSNGHENGFHSVAFQLSLPELESKKLGIEEEVDHVYDRLQALKADREFVQHCISSLKKGDKGVYLLQEILQHLRDLRSVELRVRSIEDAAI